MTSLKLDSHPRSLTRLVVPILVVALALVVPATASAAAFTAHLKAPNHTPTANKPWPITVTATRGRNKLSGSVRYEFLYDGSVVSHQPGHSFKGGVYHDTLKFPNEAAGYPLTLRVIVTTKYGTVDLDRAVKTRV
jgi:hypothetical protein